MQAVLNTSRLLLKMPHLKDAAQFHRDCISFEVVKMTSSWPWPCDLDLVQTRFENSQSFDGVTRVNFGVYLDEAMIGLIGMGRLKEKTARLGYMFGQAYWGKGYGAEAVRALCDYGFDVMGFERIEGEHWFDNPASGRVMQKIGFTLDGPAALEWCEARQESLPGFQYSLTRETMNHEKPTREITTSEKTTHEIRATESR